MRVLELRNRDRLLSAKQVLEITGYKSRVSLWKKSRDKNDPFPRPYKAGTNFTRWKESEIDNWLDQLETV